MSAPWPPRFLFIANRLCLDFAQSGGEGRWARFESLQQPADLIDWLQQCSLGLRVRRATAADLTKARQLRQAIWMTAQALVAGRPPRREDLAAITSAAARPDLVPVLDRGTAGWSKDSRVSQALASIARDAIQLFGTDARQRLRQCQNPRCPLLFVDTSRPGKRAWCSMRRCGNLEKTSRYRQTLKRKAAAQPGRRR